MKNLDMKRLGYLLKLDFQRSGDRDNLMGIAPYFREYLKQYMMAKKGLD